jgi:hypothetical protein
VIPTIRNNTIGLCLQSLGNQTMLPERVVILDSGDKPITSNYVVRMMFDILADKGVVIEYFRENKRVHIVVAKRKLLEKVTDHFMFLDDDILLEPDYIDKVYAACFYRLREKNQLVGFSGGLILLPNNEIGKPDFSTESIIEPPKNVNQYQYAYFRYADKKFIEIDYGNGGATMFKFGTEKALLESLEGLPDDAPMEDFILTRAAGRGLLRTDVVAWHLMNPNQKRDWNYALENILRRNFEHFPEKVIDFLSEKPFFERLNDLPELAGDENAS